MIEPSKINIKMVKDLRNEMECPMMACKAALDDVDGDYQATKRLLMNPPEDSEEPILVE